jgi:NADPH:quinone reductase
VPLCSAASGIVNPVTVMGMVDTFQKISIRGEKGKGIIHTAAASALGRMLNKLCIKKNIPILNIVRRK